MKKKFEYLKYYFDFLWAMTEKEIKARYKGAMFGFLWVILNPLLQMIIIGSIFSYFIKIPNYFLFLFSGLLPWQFISLSLTKATPSIVYERSLLQKAKFPIEAIPISIILSNFLNVLISFALLYLVLVLFNGIEITQILLIIPAILWLLTLVIGLGLLTSSINVRYRDVNFFVQTILLLWFYTTPILFSLKLVPDNFRNLFLINPLTTIFELFHMSATGIGEINPITVSVNLFISIVIIIVGISVFKKQSKYFIDWL